MRASVICPVILVSLCTPAQAQVGSTQVHIGAAAVGQTAPVGNIQQVLPLPDIQLTREHTTRAHCGAVVEDSNCEVFVFEQAQRATKPPIWYEGDEVARRLSIQRPAQVWLKICVRDLPVCRTAPRPRPLNDRTVEHFDGIDPKYFLPRQIFYLTWSLLRDDNTLSGARSTLFLIAVK